MTTPVSSSKRLAVAAGAVGLVGGLALGATGLASAVSPSPGSAQQGAAQPGQRPHGPGRMGERGGGGLVSAISSSSLTLRTPRGSKTVALNDSTVFYDGKEKATRAAVSVGDLVRVRLVDPRAAAPVAATVVVLPARLGGWVTATSGDVLTITDRDGFTRTIHTSSATIVTKDGAASTLSAVTVGSFVRAMGHVADDGTTLNADRLVLGAPKKGPGGPGKGQPGGPPPAEQDVNPDA